MNTTIDISKRTKGEWKDFDNIYEVSNAGKVRNKITLRQKKFSLRKSGYCAIGLYHSKTFLLHRIIAFVFIPNPNKLRCINHKDGDKQNNCVENLEWCTHKYNTDHAIRTGLLKNFKSDKKRIHLAKISANKRKPIIQYSLNGDKIKEFDCAGDCQKETGILSSNISSTCRGIYKQMNGFIFKYR